MSQRVLGTETEQTPLPRPERIAGVDAARALAVFGMFTVHLGVGSIGLLDDGPAETFHDLVRGRSAALFAFLAGISLALMSGGAVPLATEARRRASARILARALALALLGGALDLLGVPVAVILTYYGGFFALAVPVLRLRAPALVAIAVAVGVLGPQLSFVVRSATGQSEPMRASSLDGLTDLVFTGYYPACTFMAFVVAGMAVGRLDLRSTGVRCWMATSGLGLTVLGYGGSWLLMYPLSGLDRILESRISMHDGPHLSRIAPDVLEPIRRGLLGEIGDLHGQVPTDTPWWLAVGAPHSGTSFEVAGAIGTSLLVLVGCVALADVAGRAVYPLTAAGAVALTIYAGHIVVMAAQGMSYTDTAPFRLELFVAGALILAALWQVFLGRGPLERLLRWLSDLADALATRR